MTTFFKVLGAILPAYQTIALADFIDIVTQIFQGEKTTSDVFMPLLFILICIIYEKLVPAIENVIHLSAENKLSVTLGEKIVQKQSCLQKLPEQQGEKAKRKKKGKSEKTRIGYQRIPCSV